MTRERIETFREIVLPFVKRKLLATNYENLSESDAKEFTRDFNEIFDLAIKSLEQESILDKARAEIEYKYLNLTYKENSYFKASWGLRKAMEIIDKNKAEIKSESEVEE